MDKTKTKQFLKPLILIPLTTGAVTFLIASFLWPTISITPFQTPETADFIRLQAIHMALLSIGCTLLAILVKDW